MLLQILGGIWIVFGIFFLLFPDRFRHYLQRKATKKIRRVLFGLALAIGIVFIRASWDFEGWIANLLIILGIVAIIKGMLFLKQQAAEKVIAWIVSWPVTALRAAALGQIAFGALLFYFPQLF